MTQADQNLAHKTEIISADAVSSLLQAIAGLRNLRAALTMLACFALSIAVPILLWALLGKSVAGVATGVPVYIFFVATGINAGGLLLMDQAKQIESRSIADAIAIGIWCAIRSIAIGIFVLIAVLAVYLLISLLFYFCKIPGIGPLLYVVIFPASVLTSGLTFIGLFIGMMIAMGAIWDESTVANSLIKAAAVLRARLVETVFMTLVVLFLTGFVFSLVGGVLATGFLPTVGLSASILGESPRLLESFTSSLMGFNSTSGGGYFVSATIGSGLLFALMMTLVFQVLLLGMNLVYLKSTQGIDTYPTENALKNGLEDARRKAKEMGDKARRATEQARAQATTVAEKTRPTPINAAGNVEPTDDRVAPSFGKLDANSDSSQVSTSKAFCPSCSTGVSSHDRFCGACGHKLNF